MDEKEVLTRFKNGSLNRDQAAALLSEAAGAAGGAGAAGIAGAGFGPVTGSVAEPVVFTLPGVRPQPPVADAPRPVADDSRPPSDGSRPWAGPVAVVGHAGRYPGAADLAAFWDLVRTPGGGAALPPAGRPGDEVGHYLRRVQDFDAEFFGIDAHEAALTDPQERLFLETAWEALEDAGCTGSRLDALTGPDGEPRSVGVFTGAGGGDYALLAARSAGRGGSRAVPRGGAWSLPNRLSALLGLTGPSQCVDTEQSSVLVALHLALAALHRGECAAALVGGVRLRLHPFGRGAGAGEGVGALLLKPLDAALADGDDVHCLVRGSAVGHTPAGPRVAGPGRRPRGTGTGRPGEAGETGNTGSRVPAAALRAAGLAEGAAVVREDAGAVRVFVGDAGAATGAALLSRAVLRLRHREPASGARHAGARAWPGDNTEPRRLCVGARGAGGAEAQVVLEEYVPAGGADVSPGGERVPWDAGRPGGEPGTAPGGGSGRRELVVLSAPTEAHLRATAQRFAQWLAPAGSGLPLSAVARTLRAGRAAMDCRFAVVAEDADHLVRALEEFVRGDAPCADLRGTGADPLELGDAPETADYLAALWRAGRLEQVRRLWLSGVDVDWAALERTPGVRSVVVPLPPSAFLRVPLWLGGEEARA